METKGRIVEQLEEMRARMNALSASDKSYVERIHARVLRRPFTKTGCGDCYRDAIIEMSIYLKNNELMKPSNYCLCAGVILQMPSDPDVYSNANITDEVAERYLKDNPNRIGFFSVYPEDWEERIKNENPVQSVVSDNDNDNEIKDENERQRALTVSEKEFVRSLSERLKSGESKTVLRKEFIGSEIGGRPASANYFNALLKEAKKEIG